LLKPPPGAWLVIRDANYPLNELRMSTSQYVIGKT
jgi:hypothetical protein